MLRAFQKEGGWTMCATGVGPAAQCQQQAAWHRQGPLLERAGCDHDESLNPKQPPTGIPMAFHLPIN